jgi:hypothetical protein
MHPETVRSDMDANFFNSSNVRFDAKLEDKLNFKGTGKISRISKISADKS